MAVDQVQCSTCLDTVARREIREHAGQPVCLDCLHDTQQADDQALTRHLAYAA
ncbi:hypothetical protein [Kitasatospora aureofaciens]|uniref:hypothetical protein n=1 Tax=Kitasatospora aureofaciens TaxID=1894 RepID=UPI0033E28FC6